MSAYRLFQKEKDYPIVYQWWQDHNEAALALDLLSDLGVVYESDEGKPQAMTWIYLSNSKGAQIGWTVVDPALGPREKIVAASKVVLAAEDLSRDYGAEWAISFSSNSALSKIFALQGFTVLKAHDFVFKHFGKKGGVQRASGEI